MKLMTQLLCGALVSTMFLSFVQAGDQGFRYTGGKCLNDKGSEGLNPTFFGQCSDMRGVTLGGLNLDGIDFSGSKFDASNFQGSSFKNTILTGTSFVSSQLSGVAFSGAKIINATFSKAVLINSNFSFATIQNVDFSEVNFSKVQLSFGRFEKSQFRKTNFFEASLDEASFVKCDLREANFNKAIMKEIKLIESDISGAKFIDADLRAASLEGLNAEGVSFNQANLSKAKLSNIQAKGAFFRFAILKEAGLNMGNFEKADFKGATFEKANLNNANLIETNLIKANLLGASYKDAQFSGAMYNKRTQLPFEDEKAKEFGMLFQVSADVLIIWDSKTETLNNFVQILEDSGDAEITWSEKNESDFEGRAKDLKAYDIIIHFNGTSYGEEMPRRSQRELVKYVRAGGTFFTSEWSSYQLSSGEMTQMKDLILINRDESARAPFQLTSFDKDASSHPLLQGIGEGLMLKKTSRVVAGSLKDFRKDKSRSLLSLEGNSENSALAIRHLEEGKVIFLGIPLNHNEEQALMEDSIQKLFFNAIEWSLE